MVMNKFAKGGISIRIIQADNAFENFTYDLNHFAKATEFELNHHRSTN